MSNVVKKGDSSHGNLTRNDEFSPLCAMSEGGDYRHLS